ncbi:MAG TPA: TlpA disulfide reductase family protein [Aquimonas sp.]|nr:TlpA disulfide reductase family protein [Aquimonas sp.]HRF53717.1 TlpA disulfide reductase family protein [Aquimonas sp.]
MNWKSALLIVALAAVGGFAGIWVGGIVHQPQGTPPPPGTPMLAVGDMASDFQLADLQGQMQTLAQWRGKAILLNFWATWCPPCIEEMPLLDGAHAPEGDGLMVIGVALDDGAAVQQFLAKNPVSYPILLAGDTAEADLSTRFGNSKSVLPYSVLIGRDGRVLAQKFGLIRPHDLEAWQALSAP